MAKISVIIPAYNCEKYIGDSINSVLSQSFKDVDIIIIDDGSTDNTRVIIEEYIKKYPKNITYLHQVNRGPAAARNKGIKESKSQYIALLDADDKWLPNKLEESIKYLEANQFDWICTSRFRASENGEQVEERKIKAESGIYDTKSGKLEKLEIGLFDEDYIYVITSTVLINRKCFERAGLFDESIIIAEDTDMWLRFQESGLKGGYLDIPMTVRRMHSESLTRNGSADNIKEVMKVARKHAKILGIDKMFKSKLYGKYWWDLSVNFYLQHNIVKAAKYALVSFFYYPRISKIFKIPKLFFKK